LHLEFNLAELSKVHVSHAGTSVHHSNTIDLLFFPAQLFFLEADALGRKLFWQNGGVTVHQLQSSNSEQEIKQRNVLHIRVNGPRQFFSTIGLVQDIVSQRLEIGEVRTAVKRWIRTNALSHAAG
jgi:hypothetical protein